MEFVDNQKHARGDIVEAIQQSNREMADSGETGTLLVNIRRQIDKCREAHQIPTNHDQIWIVVKKDQHARANCRQQAH